jgi:hypothetical protein
MKVLLIDRERDFELERPLPANAEALIQDLELDAVVGAMAGEDRFLFDVCRRALLLGATDMGAIEYRQRVLVDCLEHTEVVREIYELAVEAISRERTEHWGLFRDSPGTILRRSRLVLTMFVEMLRRLRAIADAHAEVFASEGFLRFFRMLVEELDDEYFAEVEDRLAELKFRDGVLISARVGPGNKGTDYRLRRMPEQSWLRRLSPLGRPGYSFQIPERDEAGARALSELEDRGLNLVANALAQSAEHVLGFFNQLCTELAFYLGCLNLHEALTAKGGSVSLPTAAPADAAWLSADGLYDVALRLTIEGEVVDNDLSADGKRLVMITGANQGGKSTFLRSIGLAQLMMQCGMFVGARRLRASVCEGVFTHYKREEDETMESGKLDEELARMSEIADEIAPTCMLLCNESFASTNEREGSEIARQIVRAMTDGGARVLYVTHLFDLARSFHDEQDPTALFLRAERGSDGRRPYKLLEGEPLPTSYGEDAYRQVFGQPLGAARGGAASS